MVMKNACMVCKCRRFVAIRDRSWPFANQWHPIMPDKLFQFHSLFAHLRVHHCNFTPTPHPTLGFNFYSFRLYSNKVNTKCNVYLLAMQSVPGYCSHLFDSREHTGVGPQAKNDRRRKNTVNSVFTVPNSRSVVRQQRKLAPRPSRRLQFHCLKGPLKLKQVPGTGVGAMSILGFENCQSFFPATTHVRCTAPASPTPRGWCRVVHTIFYWRNNTATIIRLQYANKCLK